MNEVILIEETWCEHRFLTLNHQYSNKTIQMHTLTFPQLLLQEFSGCSFKWGHVREYSGKTWCLGTVYNHNNTASLDFFIHVQLD